MLDAEIKTIVQGRLIKRTPYYRNIAGLIKLSVQGSLKIARSSTKAFVVALKQTSI